MSVGREVGEIWGKMDTMDGRMINVEGYLNSINSTPQNNYQASSSGHT